MVVCGTLFMLMRKYEEKWGSVRKIDEVPLWGNAVGGEPEPVKVTLELLKIRAKELIRERAKVFLEEKDYLLERW